MKVFVLIFLTVFASVCAQSDDDDDSAMSLFANLGPRSPGSVKQLQRLWPAAIPGTHYPNNTEIPETSFSCQGRAPGFYADEETMCQVSHHCKKDGSDVKKLCGVGLVFHTDKSLKGFCDWWYNSPCGDKPAAGIEFFVHDEDKPKLA